ncbi:MAG TPA: ABC transporter substrate-binding protein [Marinobacter sp.]|nr:ABC transporter substrate-binding protein [Marinobacter sp.]
MKRVVLLCVLAWGMPWLVAAESLRVVTADGAITETVYLLGMESHLVAVDSTSRYPDAVRTLPTVGYLRALPFEGVLAVRPDLLITSEQAAPQDNLERLARAGVRVEKLPSAWTIKTALARVEAVGQLLGRSEHAEAIVAQLQSHTNEVRNAALKRGTRPRVLFILAAGNHSVMLAGEDTAAAALLETVNARNAVTGVQGYKPANREAMLALNPDAIVIAESTPGQFDIGAWPELARLGAWQSGHYLVADSMFLLGFGPRLPQAMAAVNRVLPSATHALAHGS